MTPLPQSRRSNKRIERPIKGHSVNLGVDVRSGSGRATGLRTRDRSLVQRRAARNSTLLIRSQDLVEQIAQVFRARRLSVEAERLLGRCLGCNTVNESVSREAVRDRVPVYVYRTQSRFTRSARCDRVSWCATHVIRILERLSSNGLAASR